MLLPRNGLLRAKLSGRTGIETAILFLRVQISVTACIRSLEEVNTVLSEPRPLWPAKMPFISPAGGMNPRHRTSYMVAANTPAAANAGQGACAAENFASSSFRMASKALVESLWLYAATDEHTHTHHTHNCRAPVRKTALTILQRLLRLKEFGLLFLDSFSHAQFSPKTMFNMLVCSLQRNDAR